MNMCSILDANNHDASERPKTIAEYACVTKDRQHTVDGVWPDLSGTRSRIRSCFYRNLTNEDSCSVPFRFLSVRKFHYNSIKCVCIESSTGSTFTTALQKLRLRMLQYNESNESGVFSWQR